MCLFCPTALVFLWVSMDVSCFFFGYLQFVSSCLLEFSMVLFFSFGLLLVVDLLCFHFVFWLELANVWTQFCVCLRDFGLHSIVDVFLHCLKGLLRFYFWVWVCYLMFAEGHPGCGCRMWYVSRCLFGFLVYGCFRSVLDFYFEFGLAFRGFFR